MLSQLRALVPLRAQQNAMSRLFSYVFVIDDRVQFV